MPGHARVACRYVADSESSSLRLLDLNTGGSQLLAGGDALFADNLFLFGDRDGGQALLQHPLGVACGADGAVYIADSFNHKIKRFRPGSGAVETVAGTGRPGLRDGAAAEAAFSEPGGVAVLDRGSVLVADSNNNVIRVIEGIGAAAGATVRTLELSGVPAVRGRELLLSPGSAAALPEGVALVQLDPVEAEQGVIEVGVQLPDGFHLTAGAGSGWKVSVVGPPGCTVTRGARGKFDETGAAKAAVAFEAVPGWQGTVRVLATTFFCRDNDVCLLDQVAVDVPVMAVGSSDVVTAAFVHVVRPP